MGNLSRIAAHIFHTLIGFIVGTAGVVIYNEIYVPPISGLDYNTKANIAKREDKDD